MIRFRVGDTVKIIKKGDSGSSHRLFGEIGRIIKISSNSDGRKYCCLDIEKRLPGGCGGIWLDEIEITQKIIKQFGIVKFLESIKK